MANMHKQPEIEWAGNIMGNINGSEGGGGGERGRGGCYHVNRRVTVPRARSATPPEHNETQ